MKQFQKKPVVIEAQQIKVTDFTADHPNPDHVVGVHYDPVTEYAYVGTLEGRMRAQVGDWIIRGVNGELYPCKPDIFAKTYEAV